MVGSWNDKSNELYTKLKEDKKNPANSGLGWITWGQRDGLVGETTSWSMSNGTKTKPISVSWKCEKSALDTPKFVKTDAGW